MKQEISIFDKYSPKEIQLILEKIKEKDNISYDEINLIRDILKLDLIDKLHFSGNKDIQKLVDFIFDKILVNKKRITLLFKIYS